MMPFKNWKKVQTAMRQAPREFRERLEVWLDQKLIDAIEGDTVLFPAPALDAQLSMLNRAKMSLENAGVAADHAALVEVQKALDAKQQEVDAATVVIDEKEPIDVELVR